jgi:hypothetical protein
MTIGRADKRDMPFIPVARSGRSLVWHSFAEPIWASGHETALTGRTHERTRPPAVLCQTALNPRGRSLIAPPQSMPFCLLLPLSPYRGHGSLRGRRMPPQHLVRSTGAAMSTTDSRAAHAAQRPPSQLACTLAPGGQPTPAPASCAGGSRHRLVRPPMPALTSGTASRTARCCAGSRTASWPARPAPCRCLTASRSPAPSFSTVRPA